MSERMIALSPTLYAYLEKRASAGDTEANNVLWDINASPAIQSEVVRAMAEAMELFLKRCRRPEEGFTEHFERIADEFMSETGLIAPGKSAPAQIEVTRNREREEEEWWRFLNQPRDAVSAALALYNGQGDKP